MINNSCERCKFWKERPTAYVGWCLRYPPMITPRDPEDADQDTTDWPFTTPDAWCGEFSPETKVKS